MTSNGLFIHDDFRHQILSHVARVSLHFAPPFNASQILAIQGPPGTGKTFQTRSVLKEHEIQFISIESSRLSGRYEGDSKVELEAAYLELGRRHELTALVIDDFDRSTAATEKQVERTSNSDILNLFMLHICDEPGKIGRSECYPVPIILTGNDFRYLSPPLLRPGRTKFYLWNPDIICTQATVRAIYSPLIAVLPGEVDKLVEDYRTRPVSFFQQIISHLVDQFALRVVKERPKLANREVLKQFWADRFRALLHDVKIQDLRRIAESISQREGPRNESS